MSFIQLFLIILFTGSCHHSVEHIQTGHGIPVINPDGNTIKERYQPPEQYARKQLITGSFEEYLRNLPLKPFGTKVRYYNGKPKPATGIYDGVVDLDLSNKNLQQCADAVIRLRAEYLFSQGMFEKIHFCFTNGFNAEYLKWKEGYRTQVKGNHVSWIKMAEPSDDYQVFRNYLETVFMYAGTMSLSKELKNIKYEELKAGDVFIQGGSPGHAVIVVDVAEKINNGDKVFLLAQSYMPAQDIQILINPVNSSISPWYELNIEDNVVFTPQWTFSQSDLKRFD
jgi:hypothetical protein